MTYNCKYNTYVYEIRNIENIQNILEILTVFWLSIRNMKRKMKWILIENIMGHKYIDGNRRKKYPNEKKT